MWPGQSGQAQCCTSLHGTVSNPATRSLQSMLLSKARILDSAVQSRSKSKSIHFCYILECRFSSSQEKNNSWPIPLPDPVWASAQYFSGFPLEYYLNYFEEVSFITKSIMLGLKESKIFPVSALLFSNFDCVVFGSIETNSFIPHLLFSKAWACRSESA